MPVVWDHIPLVVVSVVLILVVATVSLYSLHNYVIGLSSAFSDIPWAVGAPLCRGTVAMAVSLMVAVVPASTIVVVGLLNIEIISATFTTAHAPVVVIVYTAAAASTTPEMAVIPFTMAPVVHIHTALLTESRTISA
jgi:hypothetical protein